MEGLGLPEWAGWTSLVLLIIVAEGGMALYMARRRQHRMLALAQARETVQRTGVPATARILRTVDTGTRLGADRFFVWKLSLAVDHAAQGAFETEIRVPISPVRFGDFAEGRDIRVRIDAHSGKVVVDQRTE
ncbi:hypothetical protein AKI39_24490 [Bordetella sp. H567]|uniref:hypothetical protein n=1 Tax=Bordetella sp. H567 TaxID=1697043 RepID=UPI00081CF009|nr:hypothetical protein [Bordetella sp. H567]AOB33238.1 hypothetical protein AKI39_24490 [Bordetella sp. H567]